MPKVLRPGENRAVDAAVVCDGRVLLILRGDGGGWAFPGGMVHDGEDDGSAMLRELREETGVVPDVDPVWLGERVPVDDPRNRPDAWITTRLGLFVVPSMPHAVGADDAVDARWVDIASAGDGLYPAHVPLLAAVAGHVGASR